jgi:hypothetical protein
MKSIKIPSLFLLVFMTFLHPAEATISHGFSGTQIFSTAGGHPAEPGEPAQVGLGPFSTEWFAFAPTNSATIRISTYNSTFDTVLSVYTGPGDSYETLVLVAENNDVLPGKTWSEVVFNGTAGTTYWIQIGGTTSSGYGTIHLRYSSGPNVKGLDATLSGSIHAISVDGTANSIVAVEKSSDGVNWSYWTMCSLNSSGEGTLQDTLTGTTMFYRIGGSEIVGIMQRTLVSGYTMVGCPFNSYSDLDSLISGVSSGTDMMVWSRSLQDWETYSYAEGDWWGSSLVTTLPNTAGAGFMFHSSGTATVTLKGRVAASQSLVTGYNLICRTPLATQLPGIQNASAQSWSTSLQDFDQAYVYSGGIWDNGITSSTTPFVMGEAVLYQKP